MTTLSVVIPAYNEQNAIAQIIERVLQTRGPLACIGMALECLVVDDGSQDQTAALVMEYPGARLIRHLKNRGYGAAIKTGFRHASGEYLAFLDADGTYPPEKLPELCRAAIEHDADMVVGSRMSGAKSEMPLTRRLGNNAYAMMLSLIGNVRVRDTTSGMRVLRRGCLESLYPLTDGLDFTPAMSTRAIHENLKIIEVPIPYAERVGRSKLSVVRDGFRFTNAIVWTALAYNPVRVLGMVSLVLGVVSGLIAIYFTVLRASGVTELNPGQLFVLFLALVCGFTSTSLFSLGAMFNYLVALFHKHPVRQGLFGKPIFKQPVENYFGWFGLFAMGGGVLLGLITFVLGQEGWDITRLWFYLLAAAFAFIVGIQLFVSWIVMRILDELAQRDASSQRDLVEPEAGESDPNAIAFSVADAQKLKRTVGGRREDG